MLKVIFTALFAAFALLAGLFIAVVSMLALAVRRWLGRSHAVRPSAERARVTVRRQPPARREQDVIEVTATEVPVDSTSR